MSRGPQHKTCNLWHILAKMVHKFINIISDVIFEVREATISLFLLHFRSYLRNVRSRNRLIGSTFQHKLGPMY